MNGNHIGENIKEMRLSMGITQAEFASKINVTKSSVSAYENGSRFPSYDVLIKIAQLFRVSTDNLLGYSNRFNVEVTGLTTEQRNMINAIIEAFLEYNKKHDPGSYLDSLLSIRSGEELPPAYR